MSLAVVPVSEVGRAEWSAFADRCEQCWLFHRPEANEPEDPDFHGFAVLRDGRVLGLCMLYAARLAGARVLTYRRGYAGLGLAENDPAVYEEVGRHLAGLAGRSRCSAIQMILPSCAPGNAGRRFEDSHLPRLGFAEGIAWGNSAKPVESYTSMVDLSQSPEAIFRAFSKTSATKCRQAARLEIELRIDRDWGAFESNHRATFQRSGAPPFSADHLAWLRALEEAGFAKLLNYYHQGRSVASLLLLIDKGRATYFASGVQPDYYAHGLSASIHRDAMLHLKAQGIEWYELGQSFPTLAPSKLHSIGQFKRTFGGERWPVLAGTLVVSRLGYAAGLVGPRLVRGAIARGMGRRG